MEEMLAQSLRTVNRAGDGSLLLQEDALLASLRR